MKRLALFIALLLLLCACSPAPEKLNNQGNRAFEQGNYSSALQDYLGAQAELPERVEPNYNAANAHYRQNDYQAAQQRLLGALQNAGESLSEFIYYNLGNAFFQAGQFDQAIESYKQALRLDPDDVDAKYNLELALQKQEEQQSQEEQQEQSQQENEQSDQQEQEQQNQEQQDEQPEGQPTQQPSPSEKEEQTAQQLSQEQARQLLESAAQDTQSLQQYLQQIYIAPGGAPGEDW